MQRQRQQKTRIPFGNDSQNGKGDGKATVKDNSKRQQQKTKKKQILHFVQDDNQTSG